MKKLILLACLLLASTSFAGDASYLHESEFYGPLTIDSQHTGAWEVIDSFIFACDDTGNAVVSVSGIAILDPSDKLYLGVGSDASDFSSVFDTGLISQPYFSNGKAYIPFIYRYSKSYLESTTDTLYINAACGGSGNLDKVKIESVTTTLDVVHQNENN